MGRWLDALKNNPSFYIADGSGETTPESAHSGEAPIQKPELPPQVAGIPIANLRQEAGEDWEEIIGTPGLLDTFARSCLLTGTLSPSPFIEAPLPAKADIVWVCCGDCRHFQRDTIGDGTGIGTCLAGHKPKGLNEPAFYPRARRLCSDFKQNE